MGKTITFGDVDRLSTRFGAWLQSKGLAKGARVAVMMPNVLQYPVAVFGILRAGYTVVNVNPLYTPRELEHQLKDSGAEAIVILENFATTLEQVLPKTPVKHIVVASLGDLLGFKGLIVNFVVRNVKKMVPAFNLPGAIRFNAALSEGAGMQIEEGRRRSRGHRVPAVHRRHHRAFPRARCSCTATSSPTWSRSRPGSRRRATRTTRWSWSRRCRSTISMR